MRTSPADPRFPIEPLEALALASLGRRGLRGSGFGVPSHRNPIYASVDEVAAEAGTTRRQWYRWRRQGVPLWEADRMAVTLGRHPAELWPQWWEAA